MDRPSISTAPGNLRRVRPPTSDFAPFPGAVDPRIVMVRSGVVERPWILPVIDEPRTGAGFPIDHLYLRAVWTAVIGPGAVADLMRLATAAQRGRSLRRPTHLPQLVGAGLVVVGDRQIRVRHPIPPVPDHIVGSLHPRLRRRHEQLTADLALPSGDVSGDSD